MIDAPELEGIELPDNLLEGIAGGAATPEQLDTCYRACQLLKAKGTSMERAQEIFMLADDESLRQELADYIASIWAEL